jgi:uncharacterized protein YhbP (UPF0306 family)
MKPEDLTKQYLAQVNIMQLATAADGQPWACTVHYYSDDDFNLYWISTLERKHSQDIAQNPKVAAAVLVHENTAEEPYVIGISITGTAELLETGVPPEAVSGYATKHGKDSDLADIASGQNAHKFYRLKPSQIVLFDNKNFAADPRQQLNIKG